MSRIAVVSNHLPQLDREVLSAGGLAVSLSESLEASGGTWFGWDGTITPEAGSKPYTRQSEPYAVVSLPLSEREHAGYNVGFANRTLWPLLHGHTDLVHFDQSEFATYRAVNARFAEALAASAENHDLIWVHDYHFLFIGQELRRLGIELPTGFFLHTPFPTLETLSALPFHREIFEALSAYDLVGFQTETDLRNFHEFIVRRIGGSVIGDGAVLVFGRRFRTGVFPIGIDTGRLAKLADSKLAGSPRSRFGGCLHDRRGMIGVDRLDYTTGLAYRLKAFERMLETAPRQRKQPFLLQITAPSRKDIPEYGELAGDLEALSDRINARHGSIDWTPVRYINRAFSQTSLATLYRRSRVGLVTPPRDGINLVAQEYIAAQCADDPGVLVSSRFAGAAERLTGALLVDPCDVDAMAKTMRQALEMSLFERRERWLEMIKMLRDHDVHGWRDDFLRALVAAGHRPNLENWRNNSAVIPFVRQTRGEDRRSIAHRAAEPVSRPIVVPEIRGRQHDDFTTRQSRSH